MLVVILGAGASYDSDPDTPPDQAARSRPPLTKELFDRVRFGHILSEWEECTVLIPELRLAARRGAVEQRLEEFRDEGQHAQHVNHAVEALRYYLRSVIETECGAWYRALDRVTTYVELTRQLERWRAPRNERITFITFNYDTLLEESIRVVFGEPRFHRMDGYLAPDYTVIKLHGSTDWRHPAQPSFDEFYEQSWVKDLLRAPNGPDHVLLRAIANFDVSPRIVTVTEGSSDLLFSVPALAIPTVTKSDFECPQEHLSAMNDALNTMTKLVVIGWRGMETHFITHWRKTGSPKLQRWQICSTENGARVTEANLNSVVGDRVEVEPATRGFSEYVQGEGLEHFLNAS